MHPTVISAGYRMAADHAKKVMDDISKPVKFQDKALLMKMAGTSLSSKSASSISLRIVNTVRAPDLWVYPVIINTASFDIVD